MSAKEAAAMVQLLLSFVGGRFIIIVKKVMEACLVLISDNLFQIDVLRALEYVLIYKWVLAAKLGQQLFGFLTFG